MQNFSVTDGNIRYARFSHRSHPSTTRRTYHIKGMMQGSYILQQNNGNAPIQVAEPMMLPDPIKLQRRTIIHKTSIFLNLATIGAAANMIVGQIWGMLVVRSLPILEIIVRVYNMCFSILIIFNEMGWTQLIRESPILSSYFWRGLLYTFVGILGAMLNDIGNDNYYKNDTSNYNSYSYGSNSITFSMPTHEKISEMYVFIVSMSMFGMGAVYILLGLLRVERVVNRHKEEYQLRLASLDPRDISARPVLCGTLV